MERKITISEQQLDKAISRWRAFLLGILEASIGKDSPNFSFIRSRTLKAFGNTGLHGELKEYMNVKMTEDINARHNR